MDSSNNPTDLRSQQTELKVVGRVLNTIGVVFLSICVALSAALYEDLAASLRTIIGLLIASLMVAGGEALSRRKGANWWFPTTLMSSGYALAYFFAYSTFYVPGLRMLDHPYLTWGLTLTLGAAGMYHGSINKHLRWFASAFTLLVTGHATFHALTSPEVIDLGFLSVQVNALGCFFGMIWCAGLSSVYKRFEKNYNWPGKDTEEASQYLLNRVLHEAYFIFAALNAMALPLFLSSFNQAPVWWAIEAPILLAITWRHGNFFKHGVVGAMWLAAVVTLLTTALQHNFEIAALVAVPVSGLAIGLAYQFLKSPWEKNLKVAGYCGYLYVAIAVALAAPFLQTSNIWDAMPFWMVQSLILCGLGIALKDRVVHHIGMIASFGSLVLFGLQFHTWTWGLVGPVIAASYGLSVAYTRIREKKGWKNAEFLQGSAVEFDFTVDEKTATNLENVWSWIGFLTIVASSILLVDSGSTVIWWSVEALALVVLGFAADKLGFRLQGLLAFSLAAAKLLVWDLSGGLTAFLPVAALTLYQAFQFGVLGASSLTASFLYFRKEDQVAKLIAEEEAKAQQPQTPPTPPANDNPPQA